MVGLTHVRARAAYWQKRIELEKTLHRRQELEKMAWAEIVRLAIYHGTSAHGLPTWEGIVGQALSEQFAVARREIASRPTRPTTASARAVGGTRGSKRTD